MLNLYFYRGEVIERFGKGWTIMREMCSGGETGPIYRTLEDARNAIRKHLDSTQKAEPRIIGSWRWDMAQRDWKEVPEC